MLDLETIKNNKYNLNITIYDSWANAQIANREYNIVLKNELPDQKYDAVILAVAHKDFTNIGVCSLMKENAVLYDVKGILASHLVDGRL